MDMYVRNNASSMLATAYVQYLSESRWQLFDLTYILNIYLSLSLSLCIYIYI